MVLQLQSVPGTGCVVISVRLEHPGCPRKACFMGQCRRRRSDLFLWRLTPLRAGKISLRQAPVDLFIHIHPSIHGFSHPNWDDSRGTFPKWIRQGKLRRPVEIPNSCVVHGGRTRPLSPKPLWFAGAGVRGCIDSKTN